MRAYRDYLDIPELVAWERHSALLSMAACAQQLNRESETLALLHEAIRVDSTRASPS